jgi:hypothetical protein
MRIKMKEILGRRQAPAIMEGYRSAPAVLPRVGAETTISTIANQLNRADAVFVRNSSLIDIADTVCLTRIKNLARSRD